jgi:hypothetical protein
MSHQEAFNVDLRHPNAVTVGTKRERDRQMAKSDENMRNAARGAEIERWLLQLQVCVAVACSVAGLKL